MDERAPKIERKPRRGVARVVPWIVALAALAVVVAAFGELAHWEHLLEVIRRAEGRWIALAVVLQIATYGAGAMVLQRALSSQGVHLGLFTLVRLGLVKLFADQALPSAGVGGTLLMVHGFERRSVPQPAAMGTIVVDLVAFYIGTALAFGASLLALHLYGKVDRAIIVLAVSFALLALAIPFVVLHLNARGVARAPRWLTRTRVGCALVASLSSAPREMLRDPDLLASVSIWQIAVIVLDGASLWAVLWGLAAPAPFLVAFAAHVIATIAGILSVLPGGLGVYEGGAIGILVAMGVPVEVAVAATLIDRVISFWLPMIPGLIAARAETKRAPDIADQTA